MYNGQYKITFHWANPDQEVSSMKRIIDHSATEEVGGAYGKENTPKNKKLKRRPYLEIKYFWPQTWPLRSKMWKKNSKVNLRKTGEHPQVLRTANCYFHKVHRDMKNHI